MVKTRRKYHQKRDWLLAYIGKRSYKRVMVGEGEMEEAYAAEFGVALRQYTIGPASCPDLAATLRRMWLDGLLRRSTGGNQDTSFYCQKTYYVSYRLV